MDGMELREKRTAMGLTQKQLAEHLDVSENTVARWERGEMEIAQPSMLALALQTLNRERRR